MVWFADELISQEYPVISNEENEIYEELKMRTISGELCRSEGSWHFRPYGYSTWFFWSGINKAWFRSNYHVLDDYWHRFCVGYVDISKLMIK